MQELKNCKVCGRFFEPHVSDKFCPQCYEKNESDYSKIREYILLHPGAKIFDVSIKLDIRISSIKRYLREGRLFIMEKENSFLKCESCGKSISSGVLCNECQKLIRNDIKGFVANTFPSNRTNNLSYLSRK